MVLTAIRSTRPQPWPSAFRWDRIGMASPTCAVFRGGPLASAIPAITPVSEQGGTLFCQLMRHQSALERFSGQAEPCQNAFGTNTCSMYGYRATWTRTILCRHFSTSLWPRTLLERFVTTLAAYVLVCWQPRPSSTCRWERPLPSPLPWSRLQAARDQTGYGLARPDGACCRRAACARLSNRKEDYRT